VTPTPGPTIAPSEPVVLVSVEVADLGDGSNENVTIFYGLRNAASAPSWIIATGQTTLVAGDSSGVFGGYLTGSRMPDLPPGAAVCGDAGSYGSSQAPTRFAAQFQIPALLKPLSFAVPVTVNGMPQTVNLDLTQHARGSCPPSSLDAKTLPFGRLVAAGGSTARALVTFESARLASGVEVVSGQIANQSTTSYFPPSWLPGVGDDLWVLTDRGFMVGMLPGSPGCITCLSGYENSDTGPGFNPNGVEPGRTVAFQLEFQVPGAAGKPLYLINGTGSTNGSPILVMGL
jgi:hypothetical protein